jgi:hypothetical protein
VGHDARHLHRGHRNPTGIAFDGAHMWVSSTNTLDALDKGNVTEL